MARCGGVVPMVTASLIHGRHAVLSTGHANPSSEGCAGAAEKFLTFRQTLSRSWIRLSEKRRDRPFEKSKNLYDHSGTEAVKMLSNWRST